MWPPAAEAATTLLLAASAAVHLAVFRPYDPFAREAIYARAAAALDLGPGDTVAAPEIGALGWATRARVPEWARGEGGAIPPRLLRGTDATALVTLDRFLAPSLAADPRALDGWTEIVVRGAGNARVFRRRR